MAANQISAVAAAFIAILVSTDRSWSDPAGAYRDNSLS
jgi:hypothetical protein